jgi:outer membrane receptor protein involved in Fe transport
LDSADLLSAGVTVRLLPGFDLMLSGENLLDETYLPAADMLVAPAPGRSLGVSVRWSD